MVTHSHPRLTPNPQAHTHTRTHVPRPTPKPIPQPPNSHPHPPTPPPPQPQPRWEQEDAHDFFEFLVDRMHQEWAALGGAPPTPLLSPTAAAAAAEAAADGADGEEWLTRSGRRAAKRQPLRTDSDSAVSELFRGATLRWVQGAGAGGEGWTFVSMCVWRNASCLGAPATLR
jgi:hypothetical protein